MKAEATRRLGVLADIVRRFSLHSLDPTLQACQALSSGDALLDVAVLGQFKSGKSSLLNTVLGEAIFPVGVVPVTTVITRAVGGPHPRVRVTHLDGSVKEADLDQLSEFVTESGNPNNQRQVAVVDVFTPAMRNWPGIRLVDTPGLGSVYAHNTEATRAWMPNVAVALVTISADRPLSAEDRRLVVEARQTSPRVVMMLTKVDLLSNAERDEVMTFLDRAIHESLGISVTVLPFSSRVEPGQYVNRLREAVLLPVAGDVAAERRAVLNLKLDGLVQACRGYLTVGLQAAERADADRERLRAAVLDESVNAPVIRDELRLAEQRTCDQTRAYFEQLLLANGAEVTRTMTDALASELLTWQGNLAQQTQQCEAWMADWLTAALMPLSQNCIPLAMDLLGRTEERFRRVIEAFRDRLGRNIHKATGVTVSPTTWEIKRPKVAVVPVAVGRVFMIHWDLLSWLLPMWLVGGLFRRHVLGRVQWEVEKNLIRLTGEWAKAVNAAVTDLRTQAAAWVDAELTTLDRLLRQRPTDVTGFRDALQSMDGMGVPQPAL